MTFDINEAVFQALPISRSPTKIQNRRIEYERDYSDPAETRVIIKAGSERISIEELAIRNLAKEGYEGFHAENRFWITATQLLFYNELLAPDYRGVQYGYCLAIPNALSQRIDDTTYVKRLQELQGEPDLAALLHKRSGSYRELPLSSKVETAYRDGPAFSQCVDYITPILSYLDRSVFLHILDYTLRVRPGRGIKSMPDLLLLKNSSVSFAEVKSENDRLNEAQSRTLEFLSQELGLEVFLVEGTEILNEAATKERERFYEYRRELEKERRRLKRELGKTVGTKISRDLTIMDFHLHSMPFSDFMNLIEGFHKLGFHWISFPLYRQIVSHVDWSSVNDLPKQQIIELGTKLGMSENELERLTDACQSKLDAEKKIDFERQLTNDFMQAAKTEKDNPDLALKTYQRIFEAYKDQPKLIERIPSYIIGSLARLSLLLEKQTQYDRCLDVIEEYLKLSKTVTGWGHPSKYEVTSVEKRKARVLEKLKGK